MINETIDALNKEYDLSMTGLSPYHASFKIPSFAQRIIVKKLDNGMMRVVYIDPQNRFIATHIEK